MNRAGEGFYNPCAVCHTGIRRCACQARTERAVTYHEQRHASYNATQLALRQVANAAGDLAFGAAEIAHAMKPTRAKWWRR